MDLIAKIWSMYEFDSSHTTLHRRPHPYRSPKEINRMDVESVTKFPQIIKYMTNPSEAVQIAAVTADSRMIEYIKNPTPNVLLLAKLSN